MKIAVLMTSYNRRDTTLRCLKALFAQEGLPDDFAIKVILVDDGSTDGTWAAVCSQFPSVRLIQGDGTCYWAGGMRKAWDVAAMTGADVYFWLNDDTYLDRDALARFTQQHQVLKLGARLGILVGSTRDPTSGVLTYGGTRKQPSWNPFKLALVVPEQNPVLCDTFNGNCVWVPQGVVDLIGRMDGGFAHAMADTDYGLRARRHGVPAWVMPGTQGTCSTNPGPPSWQVPGLSLWERWRAICKPKGLPPRSWIRLALRHGGWMGPVMAVWPYLSLIIRHPATIEPHRGK